MNENDTGTALDELVRDPASRSQFLKRMGGGVAGASAFGLLLAACGGSSSSSGTTTTTPTSPADSNGGTAMASHGGDLGILNYALTLEYVEADFYAKVAASGLFSGASLQLIKVIGSHEAAHVAALKATVTKLGGTPVTKPKTKFPLANAKSVLELAAVVENLGAAAYLGQAANIKNKDVLAAALSIHSVEARHASALNILVGKSPTPEGAFGKGLSMAQVLPQVKPFLVA